MTEPNASDPTPTAPAQKSSVFDDLVEILFAPTQVFARRANAGFGTALIIVWILIAGISLASRSVYEPAMAADMAKTRAQMEATNPNMSDDQKAMVEKIGGMTATIAAVVGPPIAMFGLGLMIWLVSKVFGGTLNVGQGVLIATYAFVPRFVGALVVLGLSFVMAPATTMAQLSVGPARFLDPAATGALLLAALSRVDVFVLWGAAIIAIGYATLGKTSKGTAWTAAIVLWVLGGLPVLLGALRAGG